MSAARVHAKLRECDGPRVPVWCGQPDVRREHTQVDVRYVTCTACKVLFTDNRRAQ